MLHSTQTPALSSTYFTILVFTTVLKLQLPTIKQRQLYSQHCSKWLIIEIKYKKINFIILLPTITFFLTRSPFPLPAMSLFVTPFPRLFFSTQVFFLISFFNLTSIIILINISAFCSPVHSPRLQAFVFPFPALVSFFLPNFAYFDRLIGFIFCSQV